MLRCSVLRCPMNAVALVVFALLAVPCASEEGSCAAAGGEPSACAADDMSLLATRPGRHLAARAKKEAQAEEQAASGWFRGGRCCHGLDTCPSLNDKNVWVQGCLPADAPCSQSAGACKSASCRSGFFDKPLYCPTSSSKCALGEKIRVVTDMGFDDWGAFSVLNAAGCAPQKALGVEGMMPSNFTSNFSKLLKSWMGDQIEVYQGPSDGACYGNSPCYPDFNWLPGYRDTIFETLPTSTSMPWAEVEQWDDEVNPDIQEFWACSPGEEYTLLAISPASAVAAQLLDPGTGASTLKCIKEIVFMGGMFGNEQLSETDPSTSLSMVGPLWDVNDWNHTSLFTEVNVVSDVAATKGLWQDNLTTLGVPVRILSLETASCARVGLQRVLFRGQTGIYTDKMQYAEEEEAVEELKSTLNCDAPPNMLTKMVCIHKACDIATLDFDIVAATYVWLGDADQSVKFHFEQSRPIVNLTSGVTTKESDNSTNAWIGTTFNAPTWLRLISDKLQGK